MLAFIALMVGWIIGIAGPVIFPMIPWPVFVIVGSVATFLIVTMEGY